MSVKPLIIIHVSEVFSQEDINNFLESFRKSEINKEYFCLIVPCEERKGEVNVYYEKDFEQKKIEEIQNEVISLMKQNNLQ